MNDTLLCAWGIAHSCATATTHLEAFFKCVLNLRYVIGLAAVILLLTARIEKGTSE